MRHFYSVLLWLLIFGFISFPFSHVHSFQKDVVKLQYDDTLWFSYPWNRWILLRNFHFDTDYKFTLQSIKIVCKNNRFSKLALYDMKKKELVSVSQNIGWWQNSTSNTGLYIFEITQSVSPSNSFWIVGDIPLTLSQTQITCSIPTDTIVAYNRSGTKIQVKRWQGNNTPIIPSLKWVDKNDPIISKINQNKLNFKKSIREKIRKKFLKIEESDKFKKLIKKEKIDFFETIIGKVDESMNIVVRSNFWNRVKELRLEVLGALKELILNKLNLAIITPE